MFCLAEIYAKRAYTNKSQQEFRPPGRDHLTVLAIAQPTLHDLKAG